MEALGLLFLLWLFGSKSSSAPAPAPGPSAPAPVPPPFPTPVPIPVPIPGAPPVQPAPVPTAPPAPAPPPVQAAPATYTIKAGDTGVGLAKRFTGDGGRWKEILGANPELKTFTFFKPGVGPGGGGMNVTEIRPWNPGQVIKVPPGWPPTPLV